MEITNSCNFSCSFCFKSARKKKEMTVEEFELVVQKIKPFTHYIYLHVLGEPLLHTGFEKILQIASDNGLFVNITSNGFLLDKYKDVLIKHPVRQINVSLHDWEENIAQQNIQAKLDRLLETLKQLAVSTYINIRFWNDSQTNGNEFTAQCLRQIADYFGKDIKDCYLDRLNSLHVDYNIYIQHGRRFEWRKQACERENDKKMCYALKDHIAVLSDGTVVPCCIDADANLCLGNIFQDDLKNILNSEKALTIKQGFEQRKAVENFCKQCGFRQLI